MVSLFLKEINFIFFLIFGGLSVSMFILKNWFPNRQPQTGIILYTTTMTIMTQNDYITQKD